MKNLLSYASFIGLVTVVPACEVQTSTGGADLAGAVNTVGTASPSGSFQPPSTETCDDPSFAGISYQSKASGHFVLWYLPGTQAEKDLTFIAQRLEGAYTNIVADLSISATPTISVTLSPNRIAAVTHGYGAANAYPGEDRYEVIYNGVSDSFEMKQYGDQLSRVLAVYAAPGDHLPILTEGLAQYEDQSYRDLHAAFASQVVAGAESETLQQSDVWGSNPGSAGSLVQAMIERYGMYHFLDVYRAAAVTRDPSSCDGWLSAYGCVDSVETLTTALDGALRAGANDGWASVADDWKADVDTAIQNADTGVSPEDQKQIADVVAAMALGVTLKNADLYRSALEGIYCDVGGEEMRQDIAADQVTSEASPLTTIVSITDTGIKSYPSALVKVQRADGTIANLQMENTPDGWRLTGGDGWN